MCRRTAVEESEETPYSTLAPSSQLLIEVVVLADGVESSTVVVRALLGSSGSQNLMGFEVSFYAITWGCGVLVWLTLVRS